MPQAIPIIIAVIANASWVQIAIAVVSAAVSYYSQSEAQRKARNAYNNSLQDRKLILRGGTSPRRWALGRVRLGGTLVYADTVGTNKRLFDMELALCDGPIDAIEGYWLNDEYFSAADVSGTVPTVGKYSRPAVETGHTDQRLVTGTTFNLTHVPVSGSLRISVDQGGDNGYITVVPTSVVGTLVTLPSALSNQVVYIDYRYISADVPLRIQWTLGTQTAATSWSGVDTPNHTSTDICNGVATLRALLGWDENIYANGAPVVNVLARGVKVYDPRTTTTVWTSNPALLAAWYATLPRAEGGCGRPSTLVDWASVSAAANICEELITVKKRDGSGYEQIKRYECHTVLSTDAAPEQNLQTILSTMVGEFPFTAGKYMLFAGAHRAPSVTITDADVAAGRPLRISPNTGGFDAIPNAVTAKFVDAAQSYVETSPPDVVNDAYISDDGAEEPLSVSLLATTDARQANYLMGVALEQSRPGFAMEVTVKGAGANIRLLQGVSVSLLGYEAFAAKTWEVRARTNNFDGTYTLRLQETRSNIWALDADRYTPTTVPTPPDLSYLWSVAPVASLAATAGQPTQLPDGTAVTLATVTWASHSQDYVRQSGAIELRYRRVESSTYAGVGEVPGAATSTTITLAATANARYIIEARARNGLGAVGPWVVYPLDVVVGSIASNITARLTPQSVTLAANAVGVVSSYAGATTTVQILVDGNDTTGLWTKTRTNSSGVTSTLAGAVLTLLDIDEAQDSGYVDILCTRGGFADIPLRFGITKAKAGAAGAAGAAGTNAATVTIYKRSATTPSGPTATVTYTFATAALSGLDSGWSTSWPAGTDPVWARVVSFSGTGATDTAAAGEWTAPQIVAQNGSSGANGLNVATVYLYQRSSSATAPALPSANVTYTFASGAISGANNGWVASLPATGGAYRWVTQATAASASATDTLPPSEWAAVGLIAQDGADGSNGIDALVFELSSESVTLAATSAGVVTSYAGASTTITAKRGSAIEAGWSYSKADSAGLTTSISGGVVTVTALADGTDAAYVDITPSKAGQPTQQPKRFNVTKTRSAVGTSGPLSGWFIGAYATDFTSPYSMTATVTFFTNGTFQAAATSQATQTGYWYAPTTSGIGSSYWIKVTKLSGETPTGSALGTWLQLSSDRAFTLSGSTSKLGQYSVKVATSASDSAIVGSGYFDLGNDNGV